MVNSWLVWWFVQFRAQTKQKRNVLLNCWAIESWPIYWMNSKKSEQIFIEKNFLPIVFQFIHITLAMATENLYLIEFRWCPKRTHTHIHTIRNMIRKSCEVKSITCAMVKVGIHWEKRSCECIEWKQSEVKKTTYTNTHSSQQIFALETKQKCLGVSHRIKSRAIFTAVQQNGPFSLIYFSDKKFSIR